MLAPVAPSTVSDLEYVVSAAIADRQPIEPVGGATQLGVGHIPISPLKAVMLEAMSGIVEYSPSDLVVVAGAGMTLSSLQDVLGAHNQTLPVEVALPDTQTLGGIVASRANSLTRASQGSVRDWLIGCRVVGGEGRRLAAGGKVVKNVAGYDLPKLYCGSWGTLGVIYEVAFKVAPKPDASRLMLVSLSSERNSEDALDSLHASVTPTFTHLLNPDAGQALLGDGVPPAQFLAIAFDGHSDAIAALSNRAKQALSQFAFQIIDLTDDVAALVRVLIRDMPMRPAPLTVRCNILPSQVGAFARMLEWTARRAGFAATVFGDALAGIVYAHIYFKSGDEDDSSDAVSEHSRRWTKLYPDLRDKIDRVGGSAVFERMPQYWRDAGHPVWLPESPDIALMRGIKSQLDPHGIFRPGCYVDHI